MIIFIKLMEELKKNIDCEMNYIEYKNRIPILIQYKNLKEFNANTISECIKNMDLRYMKNGELYKSLKEKFGYKSIRILILGNKPTNHQIFNIIDTYNKNGGIFSKFNPILIYYFDRDDNSLKRINYEMPKNNSNKKKNVNNQQNNQSIPEWLKIIFPALIGGIIDNNQIPVAKK